MSKLGISTSAIEEIDALIERELKAAIEYAEQSPLPDTADAHTDIFTPHVAEV
jgi:TPP-dependent pyruvate/acetoin dehydrogenase alpha subunit